MKKILSIALAFCMILALSVTAFAESPDTWATGGTASAVTTVTGDTFSRSETIDVPGYLSDAFSSLTGNVAAANYVVVLAWTVASNLTYNIDATDYAWTVYDSSDNPSTESSFTAPNKAGYVGDGYWTGQATVEMTVTNWSNRALDATFSYADKTSSETNIEGDINTAINNARTWASSALDDATWAANATAYTGGVLALTNPATGVAIRDVAST